MIQQSGYTLKALVMKTGKGGSYKCLFCPLIGSSPKTFPNKETLIRHNALHLEESLKYVAVRNGPILLGNKINKNLFFRRKFPRQTILSCKLDYHRFRCRYCEYKHYRKDTISQHIKRKHPSKTTEASILPV